MTKVQVSDISYFGEFRALQLGHIMPRTQCQITIIPFVSIDKSEATLNIFARNYKFVQQLTVNADAITANLNPLQTYT